MRARVRMKLGSLTFYVMASHTQKLKGICSKVGEDRHILLWDFDDHPFNDVVDCLGRVQSVYDLSHIYILNDGNPESYGAICFDIFPLRKYLRILIDSELVHDQYIWFTHQAKNACLRISRKVGRMYAPEIIAVLLSRYVKPPPIDNLLFNWYDTGVQKPHEGTRIDIPSTWHVQNRKLVE